MRFRKWSLSLLTWFVASAVVSAAPPLFVPLPMPEAKLRPDQSVEIRPGEFLNLQFVLQGGKLVQLTKAPADSHELKDIIGITLRREGGVPTKLGPISPINDVLTIDCDKKLSVECEYRVTNSTKSERRTLSNKNGNNIKKEIRWGVTQMTLKGWKLE